jgi:DNA-binding transcriptional ArsR family regulator
VSVAATAHATSLSITARFFRVLGDPTRLAIVQLLAEQPRTVSDLIAATGESQSKVSNHLACLRWCEIAEAERQGQRMLYRLIDPSVVDLIDQVAPFVEQRCERLASCTRIGPDWLHRRRADALRGATGEGRR